MSSSIQFNILSKVHSRTDLRFDCYGFGAFMLHALNYFYFNLFELKVFTEFNKKTPASMVTISCSLSVQPTSHCSFWFCTLHLDSLGQPLFLNRTRIMQPSKYDFAITSQKLQAVFNFTVI